MINLMWHPMQEETMIYSGSIVFNLIFQLFSCVVSFGLVLPLCRIIKRDREKMIESKICDEKDNFLCNTQ
jgi:hypothetical protein